MLISRLGSVGRQFEEIEQAAVPVEATPCLNPCGLVVLHCLRPLSSVGWVCLLLNFVSRSDYSARIGCMLDCCLDWWLFGAVCRQRTLWKVRYLSAEIEVITTCCEVEANASEQIKYLAVGFFLTLRPVLIDWNILSFGKTDIDAKAVCCTPRYFWIMVHCL